MDQRKAIQEEKLTFIQIVFKVYQLLFWMFLPYLVALLPVIPAVLFSEWYLLFMITTIPISVALFDFITENKI